MRTLIHGGSVDEIAPMSYTVREPDSGDTEGV